MRRLNAHRSKLELKSISTVTAAITIVAIIVVATVVSTFILLSPKGLTNASSTSSTPLPTSTTTTSTSTNSIATTSTIPISQTTTSLQKVTVMVGFPPNEFFAWLAFGIEEGNYARYGLDINLQVLAPTGAIAAISAGKAQFGFGGSDPGTIAVAVGKSNITNLQIVAMVYQISEYGVLYNKGIIHSLSDLNGKSFGTYQGSSSGALFPVFAKLNHINYSSIKIITANPASVNSIVATGQAAFVTQSINALADTSPAAKQVNISLGFWPFAQFGMPIYGDSIYTTSDIIRSNPALVRSFVRASMESLLGAIHNPEQAVRDLVKLNPQNNLTIALGGWQLLVSNCIPNGNLTEYASNPLALGQINEQKMQQTWNIIASAYGFPNSSARFLSYTNQFVNASSSK